MISRGRGFEDGLGGWGGEVFVDVEDGETGRLESGGVDRGRRTHILILGGLETRFFGGSIQRRGRGRLVTMSGVEAFLAAGKDEVLQKVAHGRGQPQWVGVWEMLDDEG